MKYHGRILTFTEGNTVLINIKESINLEAVLVLSSYITKFAKDQSNGFNMVVIVDKNVLLPMECNETVISNQNNYYDLGLIKTYLLCSTTLQKEIFSESYIHPLKHRESYIVSKSFEEILMKIKDDNSVDNKIVDIHYARMCEESSKSRNTNYDLLPDM